MFGQQVRFENQLRRRCMPADRTADIERGGTREAEVREEHGTAPGGERFGFFQHFQADVGERDPAAVP
jgi:hypothetical protein